MRNFLHQLSALVQRSSRSHGRMGSRTACRELPTHTGCSEADLWLQLKAHKPRIGRQRRRKVQAQHWERGRSSAHHAQLLRT